VTLGFDVATSAPARVAPSRDAKDEDDEHRRSDSELDSCRTIQPEKALVDAPRDGCRFAFHQQ
jgi:hypothetical protein